MCHKKQKLTKISGAKPGSDPPQSAGSKTLFYPTMYHAQVFMEDSVIL